MEPHARGTKLYPRRYNSETGKVDHDEPTILIGNWVAHDGESLDYSQHVVRVQVF